MTELSAAAFDHFSRRAVAWSVLGTLVLLLALVLAGASTWMVVLGAGLAGESRAVFLGAGGLGSLFALTSSGLGWLCLERGRECRIQRHRFAAPDRRA